MQLLRANREVELFALGSVALHGNMAGRAARESHINFGETKLLPEQLHLAASILVANERLVHLDLSSNDFSTMTADGRPLPTQGWGGTAALPRSGAGYGGAELPAADGRGSRYQLDPTLPRLLRECHSLVHLDLQAIAELLLLRTCVLSLHMHAQHTHARTHTHTHHVHVHVAPSYRPAKPSPPPIVAVTPHKLSRVPRQNCGLDAGCVKSLGDCLRSWTTGAAINLLRNRLTPQVAAEIAEIAKMRCGTALHTQCCVAAV